MEFRRTFLVLARDVRFTNLHGLTNSMEGVFDGYARELHGGEIKLYPSKRKRSPIDPARMDS